MKGCHRPLWVVALALSLSLGLLTVAAEAKDACRVIQGGSGADALGEEFPEAVSANADAQTDGLGEEFPERIVLLPFLCGLGEEFPELIVFTIVRLALGEEFPE